MHNHRRTGNLFPGAEGEGGGGGGVVNHLPKKFRNLPKFLQNNRAQVRVIGFTNIGLHMERKLSYI